MTLTQSILATQSTYTMAAIHVPLEILRRLEKDFRTFLWGHLVHKRGVHLLSWDRICSPKVQEV